MLNIKIEEGKVVIPKKMEISINDLASKHFDRECEIGKNKYFVILPSYFDREIYSFRDESDLVEALDEGVDGDEPLSEFWGCTIIDSEGNQIENYKEEFNHFYQD